MVLRKVKQSLPNRWLFDLIPNPAHIQLFIPATIGGQRVSTLEDVLNHTYPDGEPFSGSPRSLVLLHSLEITSVPGEVANAYHNIPSHVPRCVSSSLGRVPTFISSTTYDSGAPHCRQTQGAHGISLISCISAVVAL